ncbi:hypothetical protein QGN23_07745 [Chryseobacterium gotjawalense]|uniref:Uncharacterized protein n=1 Tax=Chryseobacterium gotjawalense TaxID=3042315 RepID=A0ABY8R921_9FLAO|nr:hypothetical protein [Chryseobacterium sp. wdc7]WHF50341.1 hypothetical protein QGN23_07745 [Chryseobacterium sp. wdc7]
MKIYFEIPVATRLEWSSFCETQWSKKAGTVGGNCRPKKLTN